MNIDDNDGHMGKEGPICRGCFQAGCGAEAVAEEEAREAAESVESDDDDDEEEQKAPVVWICHMCDYYDFEYVEYQCDEDGIAICERCFLEHFAPQKCTCRGCPGIAK
jgi:hypothetical protein